jgi:serine/threonine-protein kinase RIO1
MSNITLNVPNEVLDEARVFAAERRTTVNALVRNYLTSIATQRKRVKQAMEELREMSEKTEARLGPDYKFDRAGLYER